jgi:hypothetical protein
MGRRRRVRKFLRDNAEHVHLDAGSQERDEWMHVRGDSRRRVQCDWSRQVFVACLILWALRKSRAVLAVSTSTRSVRLLCSA